MAFLDNLNLSQQLAPAGYAPPGVMGNSGSPPGAMPQLPTPAWTQRPLSGGGLLDPTSQQAALASQSAQAAPPKDADGGPAMSYQDNPAPQGFLAKLTATDPNGVTFNDKLMALGQILQGDPTGAQGYLEKQQDKVMQQRAIALKQQIASQQAQAFANNMRPDGSLDMAGYARDSAGAFDPDQAVKMRTAFDPKRQIITTREGGVYTYDPVTNRAEQMFAPQAPKPPPLMKFDENGDLVVDPAQIQAKAQVARDAAKARLDFHAPTRAPAGKGPKSYGANEIQWH
jgi:hypothetical protein